ncbi:diguanylate cyclase (GGDEF)-like protein [Sphingomonas sp. PvP055]|uniref:putative bifunctional diguanylate cyclase/phosphodiesterase n=1 Tax=Sphingomonas sp. PvP055 TaxID=3156391 RepID=UPI00339857F8
MVVSSIPERKELLPDSPSVAAPSSVLARFLDSLFHWRSPDSLLIEQFRILRLQLPAMYLTIVINVLFLVFVSTPKVGNAVFVMPAFIGLVMVVRLGTLAWRRTRKTRRTISEIRASMMITLFLAGTITTGLYAWTHLIGLSDVQSRTYVPLFTTLSTICCAICLASFPLAAYMVVAVGTIPISFSLMLTGDTVLTSMGANILLIAPLIVAMIYRQHQQLRRLVASRSEIALEKAKASHLAYRDSLTGLPNRRRFLDELEQALSALPRSTLAIVMIDLDDFKIINDMHGHQTGDALLCETARRFEQLGFENALPARLGGDEFAVLLNGVDSLEHARRCAAQIGAVFDQPFVFAGQTFRLQASLGMAYDRPDVTTALPLINQADLAMYEAKRRRDDATCLFQPDMEVPIRRRMRIEQALATPAETDLILLHFQPVIDAATGRIDAFEALARWTHPTLGVISPAEFIPIAEQSRMTGPLTLHLLSMALRAAASWPPRIGLSFNLSGAELNSPTLAIQLLAVLDAHGFDPGRLSIEVTETALLSDFTTARAALCALQDGGVRILLDDFGAGYASIGYLREIRFDGIKLDGSLISPLMESPRAIDLLVGVLHLCLAIGAPVTAEMVETAGQHDLLCALRVQKLQGHFLSKPLTAEQAIHACKFDDIRAAGKGLDRQLRLRSAGPSHS